MTTAGEVVQLTYDGTSNDTAVNVAWWADRYQESTAGRIEEAQR